MRRRKWWFLGLGFALLAACVGVWKSSGQNETIESQLASASGSINDNPFEVLGLAVESLEPAPPRIRNGKLTLKAKAGAKVTISIRLDLNGVGKACFRLTMINAGPGKVTLPSLVTKDYFLEVDGEPFKSGDMFGHTPPYPDYGYVVVPVGGSVEHEIELEWLLDNRRGEDGEYDLSLTYDDAWCKHPVLGRFIVGGVHLTVHDGQTHGKLDE